MSYDVEKRKLALELIKTGRNKRSVCNEFNLSRATLYNWIKKEQEGNLEIQKTGPKGPMKYDFDELVNFIKKNPNLTQESIGREFGMSKSSISLILKKMNVKVKRVYEIE